MSPGAPDPGFEAAVLPHLDAAYNLARWLTRRPEDAEDVVQEALLRALKYYAGYRGGAIRAWLLTIVRNACYSWLQRNRAHEAVPLADDGSMDPPDPPSDPETAVMHRARHEEVHRALAELPTEFREVLVLRELEGLSYKEISDVAGVPVGTVMSRLARGRQRLQERLSMFRSTP